MAEQTAAPESQAALEAGLVIAESHGAEAVREQLRELLDTQCRVVRVGETQVEVVEALHLERLLDELDLMS